MKMLLTNIRLAFPALFTPEAFAQGDKPKFKSIMIIDPKEQKALVDQIKANMTAVAKEKWGAKADANMKAITSKGNLCLQDGADKSDYDGFDGMLYISASSDSRPLLLDANKAPLVEEDGKPYAGCYANVSIDLWAMDNQYGKRVCAQLRGVQFVKDGEAFGGGGTADADEFDELEATEENVDDLF